MWPCAKPFSSSFPPSYVRDCCGIGGQFNAELWRDGSVRCAVRLPAFRRSFLDVANLGVHAHVLAPPLFLDFSALEIVAARGALGRLVELVRPFAQGIAEPWSFRRKLGQTELFPQDFGALHVLSLGKRDRREVFLERGADQHRG